MYTAIKQRGGRSCTTASRDLVQQETTFGEDWAENRGVGGSEGSGRPGFKGAGWTLDGSAWRGVLTKPQPPAWSQGSTKPEYFMAPPSTKRLQN